MTITVEMGIILGILGADGSQMRTMEPWCWNMHSYMETPNIAHRMGPPSDVNVGL